MEYIQIDKKDNVIVALIDLKKGTNINIENKKIFLKEDIPQKHKFFINDMSSQEEVIMYGVVVGKVAVGVESGTLMTIGNTNHSTENYKYEGFKGGWTPLDIKKFENKFFLGYHRFDGRVGTANHWLVIPTVFCENRNVNVLKEVFNDQLGYKRTTSYERYLSSLVDAFENQQSINNFTLGDIQKESSRVFKNIDGIKFLTHQGGCGGTREDAYTLGGLLASYIDHPNVAGATILGLGCENLQMSVLLDEIYKRNPNINKPILKFQQQEIGSERLLIEQCILETFKALSEVNKVERKPAALENLVLGVKCGGSDGFSGISANPAVGYTSDLLVSLGGKVLLAEFPELCGAEQQLLDRMSSQDHADKFTSLMESYSKQAKAVGSGFDMNPSPGNIRDGLITDAMKSNGAAKKGGNSPIVDVLDYTELATKRGLSLVCSPGNDVEATTAKVSSGANLILFTTGLGTPTGNPICPTIKVSTNSSLAIRMNDVIDFNTGDIITGSKTIQEVGEEILDYCIQVASGEIKTKADILGQDDFIPWKRGISL